MSGTGVARMVGSYAAGQALLIVAITVLPVCLTVITLVLLVEPRDRVQAIRELAPALLFTRFRRRLMMSKKRYQAKKIDMSINKSEPFDVQ